MNEYMVVKAFEMLAQNPDLFNKISLPNLPTPTAGGHVFWSNLVGEDGEWRLQRNSFTQHYRILDPDDVRMAWGGIEAMNRIFKQIARF